MYVLIVAWFRPVRGWRGGCREPSGAALRGAGLRGADLRCADLRWVGLRGDRPPVTALDRRERDAVPG